MGWKWFTTSTGGQHLNKPIAGIATTFGSVPGQGISGQPPIVGISRTPGGGGYWLVGSNGAVCTYGDAAYLGSMEGTDLAQPISGMASG